MKQNSTVYNPINVILLVENKNILTYTPLFEKISKKKIKNKKIDVSILEVSEMLSKTHLSTASPTTADAMDELLDGLPHHISKMSKQWTNGLKLAKKISYLFAKNNIGIVHAHGYSLWLAGLFLKWSYRMPLVLSDYAYEINSYNQFKFPSLNYAKDNENIDFMSDEIDKYCTMFADRILIFPDHATSIKALYDNIDRKNSNKILLANDIVDIVSFYKTMVKSYENTDAFMGIST